jgi:hypothetical protein
MTIKCSRSPKTLKKSVVEWKIMETEISWSVCSVLKPVAFKMKNNEIPLIAIQRETNI